MSSVKKYFSLKLLKTRQQMNDSGSRKLKKNHNQTNNHQQSMSVSDEDLFEENVDEEARYEEARLAEETMNTNLKLMRKQKLRFIRLQKILSRNIILIPLCVIFSIISAATIFSSTLTDYYEIFTYDEDKLRHNIELENNSTLLHIQQYLHDVNKSIDLFLKPKRTHNGNLLSYSLHSNDSNTKLTNFMLVKRDLDHRKKLYEDNILGGILIDPENDLSIQAEEISASLIPSATLHYQSLPNELKKAYVYELIRHSDYLMLYRRNFFVRDNLYMKKKCNIHDSFGHVETM